MSLFRYLLLLATLFSATASTLIAEGLSVVVKTTAGEALESDLAGLTTDSLKLEQGGVLSEIPFDDLLSLQVVNVEARTGPSTVVTLIGGSRIAAQELSSSDEAVLIEPRRQSELTIPFQDIKAIRFRASTVKTDPTWLGMLEGQQRGDLLVIRRDGDRLDPQQGLITGVTSETIGFDLGGTKVDAPVARLEGIIFGGNQSIANNAAILVNDIYGSEWSVVSIDPIDIDPIDLGQSDQPDLQLRLNLTSSIQHDLPLSQIESIRWSGGLRLLASETPANLAYRPMFATSIDAELQTGLFGPSVDGSEDLILNGGSLIEYRIEPGYLKFLGTVVRHESVAKASSVTVRFLLDGEKIWEQPLLDAELRGFELPIEGARRLAIEVDRDGDGDLGDKIRIMRPRLLK